MALRLPAPSYRAPLSVSGGSDSRICRSPSDSGHKSRSEQRPTLQL
jgi:hypothetical protein